MVFSKRAYNWYISLVAAGCMVLYGYDASVFNSVQGSENWLAYFDLSLEKDAYLIGLINTAYTIGAIVAGFFLGGPTADFLGRRYGMFVGCFLTVVATFMQTFAPRGNLGCFIGGRVIIGIGQGMALTAGPVYIGEMAPPEIRGLIMAFWQLFYSVGSFVAYWINYACSLHRAQLGDWDWKTVVVFQMLVPLVLMALLPWQPESPRWHVQRHGDVAAARAALQRVRDSEQAVESELLAICKAVQFEQASGAAAAADGVSGLFGIPGLSGLFGYSALFRDPSLRRRLFLACVLNVGQQLSGQGTLNSYSTSIYKKVWTSTTTINLINALNATCGILFTLNAAWTADRFGRRWLFIVGALGMALCMMLVPVVGLATPTLSASGAKPQPVAIAIVFLLFLFIFFYKPSWGATTWIWTAEVFSLNVRAQAVGMCSQMQNVANTIFQQFFPKFLANTGLKCLFFFMGINLLLAVFVYFFIPETRRVPLEEIDVLFGGVNHVHKGANTPAVMPGRDGAQHDTKDKAEGLVSVQPTHGLDNTAAV